MTRRTGSLEAEVARFVGRCVRDGECLMGPQRGYGWIRYDGAASMSAHRAAYLVHNGPIPQGHVVRHACDRPGCIEPSHLLVGTFADNNQDAVTRGRVRLGERHHCAERTTAEVAAAVAEYLAGGQPQVEVARKHGISQSTLGRWVRAETRRDAGQSPYRQGKGRPALARGGLKPCGTKAAYERHIAASEPPCEACRQAHRAYMSEYRANRRAARQESAS